MNPALRTQPSYMRGIDISNWNAPSDIRTAHFDGGKAFVFMEFTDGYGVTYPGGATWWDDCRALGMVRGAYHFARPNLDPSTSVDKFHDAVRNNGHFVYGDGAILDLEVDGGKSPEYIVEWLDEWFAYAETQIAKQLLLYTAPYFWQGFMGDPIVPSLEKYPLWMADWAPGFPAFRSWSTGAAFWQYDGHGHCPGISGLCDLDMFLGSWRQLLRIMRPEWAH